MPHQPGTNLGGVRTLEDLRLRCVCRPGDDCWRYRDARGRAPRPGVTPKVWVYGEGCTVPVTVAAWQLAGRERPAAGLRIGRTCDAGDCVNPAHLAAMKQKDLMAHAVRRGAFNTPARKVALEVAQRAHIKVPAWAAEVVCDKSKSRRELAERFGCSVGCISAARTRLGGRAAA